MSSIKGGDHYGDSYTTEMGVDESVSYDLNRILAETEHMLNSMKGGKADKPTKKKEKKQNTISESSSIIDIPSDKSISATFTKY